MSQETEGSAAAFQHVLNECHRWQLVVPAHEPGQEPKWRLQDPEKLDSARRDVVMMTQAFISGHRKMLNKLFTIVLEHADTRTQSELAALFATGMKSPDGRPRASFDDDFDKLEREVSTKIPQLTGVAQPLVALEYTGTVDLSKLEKEKPAAGDNGKKQPDARTMADDVSEFFDGLEEAARDFRAAWRELKKDVADGVKEARKEAAEVRAEAERDAKAAKAEVDAAIARAKERTRATWPKIRDRINAWLADEPPQA